MVSFTQNAFCRDMRTPRQRTQLTSILMLGMLYFSSASDDFTRSPISFLVIEQVPTSFATAVFLVILAFFGLYTSPSTSEGDDPRCVASVACHSILGLRLTVPFGTVASSHLEISVPRVLAMSWAYYTNSYGLLNALMKTRRSFTSQCRGGLSSTSTSTGVDKAAYGTLESVTLDIRPF